MRDRERTTVVTTDSGVGPMALLVVLIALVLMLVLLVVFGGPLLRQFNIFVQPAQPVQPAPNININPPPQQPPAQPPQQQPPQQQPPSQPPSPY